MLLRREGVVAFGAEVMVLDVGSFVFAVGHFVERQIGDFRQRFVELCRGLLLFRFQRGNRHLELRHLGHQLLRCLFLAALLRRADFLRGHVAARLCLLGLPDRRAAALVDHHQPLRFASEPAPRQRAVEGVGVFANPFDVVHGK